MLVISTDGGTVQPEHSFDTLVSISGERYDFVLAANQPPGKWRHHVAISMWIFITPLPNAIAGNYWVRVRSIGFCDPMRVEDFAILSYVMPETSVAEEGLTVEQTLAFPPNERMPAFDEPYPIGTILNHQTAPCYTPNDTYVCAADLESYEMFRDEKLIEAVPDRSFLLGFYVKRANNSLLFSDRGTGHFASKFDEWHVTALSGISWNQPGN